MPHFQEQQTTDEPIVLSQIPSQVFQVILHYAHTMQLPWMEPEEGLSLRPWAHYFGTYLETKFHLACSNDKNLPVKRYGRIGTRS